MSLARHEFDQVVNGTKTHAPSKPLGRKTTRDCPRVTLRFSEADYAKLRDLADGMALSTFIRARALSDELPKRRGPKAAPIQDQAALAQVLALLGQSRIANNLNQLAYHANIGALSIEPAEQEQINEAYAYVGQMRALLLRALGKRV
ncbi:plasmid mobilization protein [Halovulum sp. GXIMD14793]